MNRHYDRYSDSSSGRADQYPDLYQAAIVDLFAGGGGWSIGTEQALIEGGCNQAIDLMVNHWDVAVGVHRANHPLTEHLQESVWEVDPAKVLPGRRIAYLHASPDCTHFSKARGSKPKKKEIRGLAWVVVDWAAKRRPDVITLENVEEFRTWGPLARDGQPCRQRQGQTFRKWMKALETLGYVVEHRELRACDYGAPTTRKRLFVIARCDGKPIVWPEKTHGKCYEDSDDSLQSKAGRIRGKRPARLAASNSVRQCRHDNHLQGTDAYGEELSNRQKDRSRCATHSLKPLRTAAECIDWSIPMLSIFASPEEAKVWAAIQNERISKAAGMRALDRLDRIGVPRRPLKPKTLERIARGLVKFVIEAKRPFIIRTDMAQSNSGCAYSVQDPLTTVTSAPGHAVVDMAVAPYTAGVGGRAGQSPATGVDVPMPTVTGKADRVLVTPIITRCGHGDNAATGNHRWGNSSHPTTEPLPTVTGSKDYAVAQATLSPYTVPNLGEREGQAPRCGSVEQPLPTVTSKGNGARLVTATLQTLNHGGPEHRAQSPSEPLQTVTGANDARALVAALVTKHYGDAGQRPGSAMDEPLSTVTSTDHNAVTCAYLSHFYTSNTNGAQGDPTKPLKTVTGEGGHAAIVEAVAAPYLIGTGGAAYAAKPKAIDEPANTVMVNDRRALVAAFLSTYYGNAADGNRIDEPAPTVVSKDRIQLVTVLIDGQTYVITDIAMRMLTPRELARAQGFDDSYIIDRTAEGKPVTKADQVKLIGNSVPPPFARAIVKANVVDLGVLDDAATAAGVVA